MKKNIYEFFSNIQMSVENNRDNSKTSAQPSLSSETIKSLQNRSRRNRGFNKIQHIPTCCAWCDAKNTPEWRSGPQGTTLCNACGLQYRNKIKALRDLKNSNDSKISIASLLNDDQSPKNIMPDDQSAKQSTNVDQSLKQPISESSTPEEKPISIPKENASAIASQKRKNTSLPNMYSKTFVPKRRKYTTSSDGLMSNQFVNTTNFRELPQQSLPSISLPKPTTFESKVNFYPEAPRIFFQDGIKSSSWERSNTVSYNVFGLHASSSATSISSVNKEEFIEAANEKEEYEVYFYADGSNSSSPG